MIKCLNCGELTRERDCEYCGWDMRGKIEATRLSVAKRNAADTARRKGAAETVINALRMGVDPQEALAVSDYLIKAPKDASVEVQSRKHMMEVCTSREFNAKMIQLGESSAELIEPIMEGMRKTIVKYNEERDENPDIHDRDARVATKTFLLAAGLWYKFFSETQPEVIKTLSASEEHVDYNTMSAEEINARIKEVDAKLIEEKE